MVWGGLFGVDFGMVSGGVLDPFKIYRSGKLDGDDTLAGASLTVTSDRLLISECRSLDDGLQNR